MLLEETPHERDLPDDTWSPHPAPTSAQLLARTVRRNVTHPAEGLGVAEFQLRKVLGRTPAVVPKQPPVGHALTASLGQSRRFATVSAALDDHRLVRDAHGGTVNDVVLAAIAGGLRGWMLTGARRSARAPASARSCRCRSTPRTACPRRSAPRCAATCCRCGGGGQPGRPVAPGLVRAQGHRETGSAVAANRLAGLPGFATSTFHAVGARVGEAESGRGYQLLVTNVPGPQDPVYMAGSGSARSTRLPLTGSRALAIGVTSYAAGCSTVWWATATRCATWTSWPSASTRRWWSWSRASAAGAGLRADVSDPDDEDPMRIYAGVTRDELEALHTQGTALAGERFVAATDDEEDEAAALEAAAEAGDAAVVAELDDEDAPIALDDVDSIHVDADGTGDLAWYARQELPPSSRPSPGPSSAEMWTQKNHDPQDRGSSASTSRQRRAGVSC